jgi:putative transposase
MARKPRIEYEGAFYHVITRGNQKQKIFKDKEDFLKYLEILSDYKKLYAYFLYAYILMSNHVHILIEIRKTPLSKILQGINQRYTAYFNRRYKTVGHLFQGRYKAILCDRDEYLLSLIKYIHFNPVRAKIVKFPDEYPWSSHHSYIKKREKTDGVDTEQVLRMFSEDKTKARKLYRAYMGDGIMVKKEDIYSTIDQRILGNEGFADKVIEEYKIEIDKTKKRKRYSLSEIAKGIEKAYGITMKQLQGKGKDKAVSVGKKLFSVIAKEYGYTGREIAKLIKKDPAIVTRHLREKGRFEKERDKVIKTMETICQ